jgi:DNA-binding MarR family transcriptional regulator
MHPDTEDERLAVGLVRLAAAMHAATDGHASGGPNTLVDQQVVLMLTQGGDPSSVDELAAKLGMSVGDLVEAVGRLRADGLVRLDPAPSYDPAHVAVSLTQHGRELPQPLVNWAAHLLARLNDLSADEQSRLLATVCRQIVRLQRRDAISTARMCLTCRYFQPYAHAGAAKPHHCALVDAPFGHAHIRVHCPEQQDPPGGQG